MWVSGTSTYDTAFVNWVEVVFTASGGIQSVTPHRSDPPQVDLDENDGWMRAWARHGYQVSHRLSQSFMYYARYVADKKAERLMLRYLTNEQKEEYLNFQNFKVRTLRGNVYRIRKGRSGNVDRLDDRGRVTGSYCAHPANDVPNCDTMLAQKLMLEHDEDSFLSVANRSR